MIIMTNEKQVQSEIKSLCNRLLRILLDERRQMDPKDENKVIANNTLQMLLVKFKRGNIKF